MSKLKQIFKVEELETIYTECAEERETNINFSATSPLMTIYTADNTTLTKLKKIMSLHPEDIECYEAGRYDGKVTGYIFKMSKKHLSIRQTAGREVSEACKKAAQERMTRLSAEGKLNRGKRTKIKN